MSAIEVSHIIVSDASMYGFVCTEKRLKVGVIRFTVNCKFTEVVSNFFSLYLTEIVNQVHDLRCYSNTCQIWIVSF